MLKFDDLAPLWSGYYDLLAQGKTEEASEYYKKHGLSWLMPDRCTVGEAWKYKNTYTFWEWKGKKGCKICNYFSMGDPYDIPAEYKVRDDSIFASFREKVQEKGFVNWRKSSVVKKFLKHWNEAHAK